MEKHQKYEDNVLKHIAEKTRLRIDKESAILSLAELKERSKQRSFPILDFRQTFITPSVPFPVIAEVKMASPSQGVIASGLDPVQVAIDYVHHGAQALSVLTETEFFKGDVNYLRLIRKACPKTPILMKDFFLDEYQLYQAVDAGADAILIIVAMLGERRSKELMQEARQLGLSVLVEVHDEPELEVARRIGADFIGINSRDLKTLKIDIETIFRLLPLAPKDCPIIGESGIRQQDDLRKLKSAGCAGFLIGTHLMKTGQPGQALAQLLGTNHGKD